MASHKSACEWRMHQLLGPYGRQPWLLGSPVQVRQPCVVPVAKAQRPVCRVAPERSSTTPLCAPLCPHGSLALLPLSLVLGMGRGAGLGTAAAPGRGPS